MASTEPRPLLFLAADETKHYIVAGWIPLDTVINDLPISVFELITRRVGRTGADHTDSFTNVNLIMQIYI